MEKSFLPWDNSLQDALASARISSMLHLCLCRDRVGSKPLLHVLTVFLGARMYRYTACVLVIHRTLFRAKVKVITEKLMYIGL